MSTNILVMLYTTLVRSHLECANCQGYGLETVSSRVFKMSRSRLGLHSDKWLVIVYGLHSGKWMLRKWKDCI